MITVRANAASSSDSLPSSTIVALSQVPAQSSGKNNFAERCHQTELRRIRDAVHVGAEGWRVFAQAILPFMLKSDDNPDGPLTKTQAAKMTKD